MTMVLVTGAAGFIGSEVCRLLTTHGHQVIAQDRASAPPLPCPCAVGDICDVGFLDALFSTHTFDAIVHLAAMRNSASQENPQEAMRVNIGASLSLLRLAQQAHVPKFIFGSSISAYGPKSNALAQHGEVNETDPAAPDNVYGIAKRYVEVAGEQMRQGGHLQFVALRMAMVVGAGVVSTASAWRGEIFEKLDATQHTLIHLPFAATDIVPLIHVTDTAEIIATLVDAGQPKFAIYNTPAENWQCSQLASFIHALNANVELAFSPASVRGDPEAIDGRRFVQEFAHPPMMVSERLRLATYTVRTAKHQVNQVL